MKGLDFQPLVVPLPISRASPSMGILVLACLVPLAAVAQDDTSDWTFAASIYGWFPDIGGHTGLPGDADTIDIDVGTILDHLKMTAQGTFEMHKGKWGAFTDIVYLDVADSTTRTRALEFNGQPLPATITTDAKFDLESVFWTIGGTYRLVASPATTLDLLAGTRLASFKQKLEWEFTGSFGPNTPPPSTGSRSASVDQWDAVIGARGQFAPGASGKWVLPYYLDVGTGDSDLTWQGMLGLGYAFGWGDIKAVWRYLDYDLNGNGPIKDMDFNGPALGVTFHW